MSADVFRLFFVLVCVSPIVVKITALEAYVCISLLKHKLAKNTLTYLGVANVVSHLEGGPTYKFLFLGRRKLRTH